LRKEVIHLLRKLSLLAVLATLALGVVQAAVASPGKDKNPPGNAFGHLGVSDGR
jgi:hypothetical protein